MQIFAGHVPSTLYPTVAPSPAPSFFFYPLRSAKLNLLLSAPTLHKQCTQNAHTQFYIFCSALQKYIEMGSPDDIILPPPLLFMGYLEKVMGACCTPFKLILPHL